MAYGLRYQYEFQDYPSPDLDLTQWAFRVSFLLASYTGPVVTVLPDDQPLVIQTEGIDTNNLFAPIIPQKYQFRLLCQSSWEASDFYVATDRDMQVLIEYDKTNTGTAYQTLRRGWVLPVDLKEAYQPKPYPVEISAACGLSTLKERAMVDGAGIRLQGMVPISQVIRTALLRTDLTSSLTTGFNLYEITDVGFSQVVNGLAAANKDPLFQTLFDARRLINDINEPISCYDALIICLLEMAGCVVQIDGAWWAVRKPEVGGKWDPWNGVNSQTIHVRKYTSADLSLGPDAGADASINLNVTADFFGKLRVKEGGEQLLRIIKSGVRIEQSFGRWLAGLPDFSQYDTVTHLPAGWLGQSLAPNQIYRQGTGTEVDPYRMTIAGGSDQYANFGQGALYAKISYPEGSPERTKYLKRTIKGRYRLNYTRAAQVWAIIIRQENGPHIPVNGEWKALSKLKKNEAETARFNNTYTVDGVVKAKPGWADFSYELPVIDGVLELYVFLGMAEKLDVLYYDQVPLQTVEYANVRMEVETDGFFLNGTQQTIVKSGQTVKDTTLSIGLGDVPEAAEPTRRLGSFYNRTSNKPTRLWFKPDANPGGLGNGVLGGKTLISLLTEAYARQIMFPAPVLDTDLIGRLPYGPLSVLTVSDLAALGKAPLTSWEWVVQDCEHKIIAQRLADESTAGVILPTAKKEWQTPDGPFDMVDGADGEPVAPPEKPPRTLPTDDLKKKLIELGYPPGFNPSVIPSGFTPGTSGKFGANLYNNNQLLASLLAQFRKQVKFKFPP